MGHYFNQSSISASIETVWVVQRRNQLWSPRQTYYSSKLQSRLAALESGLPVIGWRRGVGRPWSSLRGHWSAWALVSATRSWWAGTTRYPVYYCASRLDCMLGGVRYAYHHYQWGVFNILSGCFLYCLLVLTFALPGSYIYRPLHIVKQIVNQIEYHWIRYNCLW